MHDVNWLDRWNLGQLHNSEKGGRAGGAPHQAGFLDSREDSPPSAKDKAPGEKQMPTGPYVPLAVASESA